MGVDYYAHSGIGFMVRTPKEFEGEGEFDFFGYLDEVLQDSGYVFFETGEGAYTGEGNDYYVALSEFRPVNNLAERANDLKNYLIEHDLIDPTDDYDLVGGLEVC
ncbi:anti-sigma-factor antagonist [Chryseobacterium sp. StRB126]|uniref:hypothetical protein n=1 Tax=Chryseobacterium sp. StRB126 TaxID=878220 RepID=UPI0004E988B7|nr:hypothetical protein [Chryseobacterium sp. StRB126]BAP30125.1 anti-sigma-factor antagonist [Chryseobacterium sp. StRB126]